MLDDIFDFFAGSHLAAIATVLIGCYILRDIVRTCLYIFESSRRHSGRMAPEDPGRRRVR